MTQAFIALGSNLADPMKQIQTAFVALAHMPKTQLIKQSSLYKTAPIGYEADQLRQVPDFINAVAELQTELKPLALLAALFDIENQAGRKRPYPNAPRVLDCDLLLYDNLVLNIEQLTLPHPRMHTRGFVLLPLFEIAPHLSLPNHGKISLLINSSQFTGVQKLES